MLYAKKLVVNSTSLPVRSIGPSIVPTKVASLIQKWPQKWPKPVDITGSDGTITVPAARYDFQAKKAALSVMKSFDSGEQLLHNGADFLHPQDSMFGFFVNVPETRSYYLTVNFTTWHMQVFQRVKTQQC